MTTRILFEYAGFTYQPERYVEDDNVELFHTINFHGVEVGSVDQFRSLAASPYRLASELQFRTAVENLVN